MSKQKKSLASGLKGMFGGRFRAGSYSAFAAAVVITIAVLANMMAASLPAEKTQLDLTSNALYSLSDQTKQIVASVNQDVQIFLICNTGNEDEMTARLLDRYAGLSDHVSWSSVDPTVQPTFLHNYDLDISKLYENSVLVVCGNRSRLVGYDEIYLSDYSMNYYSYSYDVTYSFDGENALTTAIHYVASDDLPKVYLLTGHGEAELGSNITEMLARDNFETESLSLLMLDEIPDDATALLINAPASDLSEDEADMLIAYLENGGSIALLTSYMEADDMPQLRRVTRSMGLDADTGIIIEGDRQKRLSRYPHYLLPDIASHDVTDALITARYYILTPLAQPLIDSGEGDAYVTWLLTTSSSAYAKQGGLSIKTTEKEDGDTDGPFYVGAISEGTGTLLWIAADAFLDSYVDSAVSGANSNLFLNALNYMGGQEESISIRAKSLDREGLTLTQSEASLWTALMIGIIPAILVAVGVIIWIRRKRR